MRVPDQRHINKVCEHLWHRPGAGASVMIGSGFSRNARKVRPASKPLPMLDEIARDLSESLYPHRNADEKVPPERVLRLAQAYEAEFGPTALHEALKRMVADDDVMPGGSHERLLRLPWADVFTTNWDTLLERASEIVRDRNYTVVLGKKDIPWKPRPRIVKLHGSLPDPPLILTEEDYRTYPTEFSPFVNTVQQAMMETIFVLIGFSGNDPNFLHWSGWVRDNLGEAAPEIYIAGILNLSRPERRMLQDRHVFAIDLAQHPEADKWPDRHKYATEWILSTLECGQPYDPSKWPSPRDGAFCGDVDPLLQPIARNVSAEPREEIRVPSWDIAADERLATTMAVLDTWRHNRKCYPGWLVPPPRVRDQIRVSTENWTPVIMPEVLGLTALERLDAIREIIWRCELTLAMIPTELEEAAVAVLESIDCAERTVDGNVPDDVDWAVIREAWREVALALLTAARFRFDHAAFKRRVNALTPFLGDDVEVAHRVRHERCLWELWSLDHATLGERLDAWRTGNGDSAWAIRKSALLMEIGRREKARELLDHALGEIRSNRDDGYRLSGSSREGWALWSLWSLVDAFADTNCQAEWNNIQTRWDQLAAVKCDPSPDVRYLGDELTAGRREARPPAFDLGVRLTKKAFLASPSSPSIAGYQAMRLTEVAGLAPATDVITDAGKLVERAAEALMREDAAMGIRQMIRVTTSDSNEAFMHVLSRSQVASLTPLDAIALAKDVQSALNNIVPFLLAAEGKRRVYGWRRASVVLESLSRLVMRVDGSSVLSRLDFALDLYNNHATRSWSMVLHNPMRNLLRRCWESLDEEQRRERIISVLEMPIVGLDGFTDDRRLWPEPGEIFSEDVSPPRRSKDNEDRWQAIVSTTIRGLRSKGEARRRAAIRIAHIALWDRLDDTEREGVAEALWSSVGDEGRGLPDATLLRDYAFILLPEPTVGMGRVRFGRMWLSGDVADVRLTPILGGHTKGGEVVHKDPSRADDILWQAGMSIAYVRRHGRTLDLTYEEQQYLIGVMEQWSQTKVSSLSAVPEFFRGPLKRSIWDACRGLRWILTEIEIGSDLAGRLYRLVPELLDSGIPAYGILPGIASASDELREDVALGMSTGLASDNQTMAESAMWSLHCWTRFASDRTLDFVAPPEHLIREIGVSVATRRGTVLAQALYAAKWIFEEGGEDVRRTIRDLVLRGLGYLGEELRYDREDPFDGKVDVPLTRWRGIQVARAMAGEGLGEDPVIRRWLQLGMDDPLPEVRHVADRWRAEDGMIEVAGSDLRNEIADEGAADA